MFRRRDITLAILARFVSRVGGTAVFFIGIWGVAAYSFHASVTSIAVLMAGNSVAGILSSVVAGGLIDRVGPRKVLIGAELLTVPAVLALIFARSYPVFVALAWLFSLVASPTYVAGAAFAPFLATEPHDLERINGRIEAAGSAGFVLGPALGALVARVWGLPFVFVVMGVTSAVAAGITYVMHLGFSPRDSERSHPLAELKDGLTVAYTTRAVRYAILVGSAVWFGFGAFSALEPLFYRDVVKVGVEWIGWMNTSFSVGLVVGAWGLTKLPSRFISARGLAIVAALCGLGALAYVGTTVLPVIAVGAALWGLVIGAVEPLLRTILQMAAPEGYLGRVVGAAQYHREAGELVPLALAPAAAAAFGIQPTLIGGGVIVAVAMLLSWPIAAGIDDDFAARGTHAEKPASGPAHVGLGDEIL